MAKKGFDLAAASPPQLDLAIAGLVFILVMLVIAMLWLRTDRSRDHPARKAKADKQFKRRPRQHATGKKRRTPP